VVASWTNSVHTYGTFAGYREISSPEKWLRVHNTQEWNDYYNPKYRADLKKFFDHYLKGEDNGWEKTPKVRLSVYDPGHEDIVDRVETEFPLARTRYEKLYLDGNTGTLEDKKVKEKGSVSYDSEGEEPSVAFTYSFDKDTELTGYMKLHLWVEAESSDDMDLAVKVEKIGADGKELNANRFGSLSADGYLRVSCRELDKKRSTEAQPYLAARSEKKIKPGEVVPVEIGIWPMGTIYHKGEKLRLTVSAYRPAKAALPFGIAKIEVPKDVFTYMSGEKPEMLTLGGDCSEVADASEVITSPATHNSGRHIFHTGGRYDSYLLVPVIPEKK